MSIKYTNIFHCKTVQNVPKLRFFGLKINLLATPAASLVYTVLIDFVWEILSSYNIYIIFFIKHQYLCSGGKKKPIFTCLKTLWKQSSILFIDLECGLPRCENSEIVELVPGANPTIVSYNASVVKIYIATSSPVRLENKIYFFCFEKNALAYWRCSCR
jgi:hypothetical protein